MSESRKRKKMMVKMTQIKEREFSIEKTYSENLMRKNDFTIKFA